VQVNQFTTRKDGGVAFSKFDVIWPPTFTGKIKFSASDFQSNKKCGQRLAFSVGNERGKAASTAKDDQTKEPDQGVPASDLEAVTQRRSRVKAAGEPEKLGTKAALGRDRQK
jgi:hypothetical protein